MILCALPAHTTESTPAWPGADLRSWRWAIEAGRWHIGISEQMRRVGASDEWVHANRYYLVGLIRWNVGVSHDYYDGPHCSVSLGWLRAQRSGDWCERCMPPVGAK